MTVSGPGVVIGFDDSAASTRALEWAAAEAAMRRVRLTVCLAWRTATRVPFADTGRAPAEACSALDRGVVLASRQSSGLEVVPRLLGHLARASRRQPRGSRWSARVATQSGGTQAMTASAMVEGPAWARAVARWRCSLGSPLPDPGLPIRDQRPSAADFRPLGLPAMLAIRWPYDRRATSGGTMGETHRQPEATIESRLERLERKVDVLSDALRVLAHGSEGGPLSEPGADPAAHAARQAYELLLTLQQREGQDAGRQGAA